MLAKAVDDNAVEIIKNIIKAQKIKNPLSDPAAEEPPGMHFVCKICYCTSNK
jgi:hypothetical protein